MSNYIGKAINPNSGVIESASFIDDHYGNHQYGVTFSDRTTYPDLELVCVQVVSEERGAYFLFYRNVKGSLTRQPNSDDYRGSLQINGSVGSGHAYGGRNLPEVCQDFKKAVDSYLRVN